MIVQAILVMIYAVVESKLDGIRNNPPGSCDTIEQQMCFRNKGYNLTIAASPSECCEECRQSIQTHGVQCESWTWLGKKKANAILKPLFLVQKRNRPVRDHPLSFENRNQNLLCPRACRTLYWLWLMTCAQNLGMGLHTIRWRCWHLDSMNSLPRHWHSRRHTVNFPIAVQAAILFSREEGRKPQGSTISLIHSEKVLVRTGRPYHKFVWTHFFCWSRTRANQTILLSWKHACAFIAHINYAPLFMSANTH